MYLFEFLMRSSLFRVGALLAAACVVGGCSSDELRTDENTTAANVTTRSHDPHDGNLALPAKEIDPLERRAVAGDDDAANILANHYMVLRQFDNEIRWRTVAANRGHCLSLVLLEDHPTRAANARWARHWNDQLRTSVCTHGKAYISQRNTSADDLPLWDDE
jgi:hypothetical protein